MTLTILSGALAFAGGKVFNLSTGLVYV